MPEDASRQCSEILEQLYDGAISASTAGNRLATIALQGLEDIGLLWHLLLRSAKTASAHHDKLVATLTHMSQLPPAARTDGFSSPSQYTIVWSDMPRLGWQLNYEWNSLCIPSMPGPERQRVINAFIAINTLCAKLMATKQSAFNYSIFALWTMRAALETPLDQQGVGQYPPEAYLPAAATWIEFMGEDMITWDEQLEYGGNKGDPGRNGPLCPEKHGFDRERWYFWQNRFVELGQGLGIGGSTLDNELRHVSKRAHLRMEQVEARLGHRRTEA